MSRFPASTIPTGDLVETVCPVCGGGRSIGLIREKGFGYQRCASCGLVYQNPRPTRAFLDGAYRDYLPASGDRAERWRLMMLPVYDWARRRLEETIPPGSSREILDVGCGHGFFVKMMADAGWRATGMDASPQAVEFAAGRLGVDARRVSAEEWPFGPRSLDAITAFYVIEHIERPMELLRQARETLRPGGALLLRWPSTAGLLHFARVLGRGIDLFQPPFHLTDFTVEVMERCLRRAGFVSVSTCAGGATVATGLVDRRAAAFFSRAAGLVEVCSRGRVRIPGISRTTVARVPGK
jgi:SAM-dependent methyltransferase